MPTSLILLTVSGREIHKLPKVNNKPIKYRGVDMGAREILLAAPKNPKKRKKNKIIAFKIKNCQYSFLVDFPRKLKGFFQADK